MLELSVIQYFEKPRNTLYRIVSRTSIHTSTYSSYQYVALKRLYPNMIRITPSISAVDRASDTPPWEKSVSKMLAKIHANRSHMRPTVSWYESRETNSEAHWALIRLVSGSETLIESGEEAYAWVSVPTIHAISKASVLLPISYWVATTDLDLQPCGVNKWWVGM